MKFIRLFLLFFILGNMINQNQVNAAEPLLQYVVRQPKVKTDRPPLLVLLHGIGSNERDLFSFADKLPGNFLVVSARGPYTLGKDSYAWYHAEFSVRPETINAEEAEKSRLLIMAFIKELKHKYKFDNSRVYLCGFSQGAIMSYSVGLTHPGSIKGIAAMSGRVLGQTKSQVVASDKLKHLEVFVSHGTNDRVLDIQNGRDANAYLNGLGIQAQYKEYADVHTINQEMLTDLITWLGKR